MHNKINVFKKSKTINNLRWREYAARDAAGTSAKRREVGGERTKGLVLVGERKREERRRAFDNGQNRGDAAVVTCESVREAAEEIDQSGMVGTGAWRWESGFSMHDCCLPVSAISYIYNDAGRNRIPSQSADAVMHDAASCRQKADRSKTNHIIT